MFVNPEVGPGSLPAPEELHWQPLHPRFARRLQAGSLIRAVLFAVFAGGVHFVVVAEAPNPITENVPWLPALAWTLVGMLSLWMLAWPVIAVPRRGYVVRERDLVYKSGVLWRSVRAFPFNRVQHTKIDSTPLDRRWRLANLSVFPAGAGAGHKIRGLGQETAERLRVYISARIEAEAEMKDEPPAPPAEPGEPADPGQ